MRHRMCQTTPSSRFSKGFCMRGAPTPTVHFNVSPVRWVLHVRSATPTTSIITRPACTHCSGTWTGPWGGSSARPTRASPAGRSSGFDPHRRTCAISQLSSELMADLEQKYPARESSR